MAVSNATEMCTCKQIIGDILAPFYFFQSHDIILLFFNFIFQIQFAFSIIFCSFKVYSRWLNNHILYKAVPPVFAVPTRHHTVITAWLTTFPALHCTSPWLRCNRQPVLLNPFTFFTQLPQLPPNLAPVEMFCVSMSLFQFCLFIYCVL